MGNQKVNPVVSNQQTAYQRFVLETSNLAFYDISH